MVDVELVYVPSVGSPLSGAFSVPQGATVSDVLEISGWLERYPEVRDKPVGIFGKCVAYDAVVRSGDRIEIYRPLLIDPKEKRRQRAGGKS